MKAQLNSNDIGDDMWVLRLVSILYIGSTALCYGCPSLDYQELKDMDDASLTKEYCRAFNKAGIYKTMAEVNQKMADTYQAIGNRRKFEELDKDATDQTKASVVCANQVERMQRIVAQRNMSSFRPERDCSNKNNTR